MTRRDSYTAVATYSGEEITASFTQTFLKDDCGVPGSPIFWSPANDVECTTVEILGKPFQMAELHDKLQELIIGLADELEWEHE